MLFSVQTHFDEPIGRDILSELYRRRFRMVRIDAQQSSIDVMLAMVAETFAERLVPYVTIARYEQIDALPHNSLSRPRSRVVARSAKLARPSSQT
jgi:hypothetical protein